MMPYQPYDFYILRSPTKSITDLVELNNQLAEDANDQRSELSISVLKKAFGNNDFLNAVYLASPELHQALTDWLEGKKLVKNYQDKLVLSAYKYFKRMSSRCTPFGLFASCSLGKISSLPSSLTLNEQDKIETHSRLDMNYVGELTDYFNRDPNVQSHLMYYPNETLYIAGDKYRYIEYKLVNKRRSYTITSINTSSYLKLVLSKAEEGAQIPELVQVLETAGVLEPEAMSFIRKLIKYQILKSDMNPTVTGTEFFDLLTKRLAIIPGQKERVNHLKNISLLLAKEQVTPNDHHTINKVVSSYVPTSTKNLVQTDVYRELQTNQLNQGVIQDIASTLLDMKHFMGRFVNKDLTDFKRKFLSRYEQEFVPLLEALDTEIGIGYGISVSGNTEYMPLMQGLGSLQSPTSKQQTVPWDKISQLVFKKAQSTNIQPGQIITLTDAEVGKDTVSKDQPYLSPNAYIMGSLLAPSVQALDRGNYKFTLSGIAGPSSANLIARFCHGNTRFTEKTSQCIANEDSRYPDKIVAEIVHLPEARIGNILLRPDFRNYEIPFLGASSQPKENQIPLSDLLITVRNNQVILFSKKLKKEIIPRLTNAHNFSHGLSIYRFLCDLQFQNQAMIRGWDWTAFKDEPFLPRVEYRKVILHRARWFLKKEQFKDCNQNQLFRTKVTAFFREYQVPRWVAIIEGDNELLIDTQSTYSIDILFQTVRKRNVELLEFLSTPENCFVGSSSKKFTNEFIFPLTNTNKPKANRCIAKKTIGTDKASKITRSFHIGSEWLYLKIYLGNNAADKILNKVIHPLAEQLLHDKVIDQWFFIRYNDPHHHLRLRFHCPKPDDCWQAILTLFQKDITPWINNKVVFHWTMAHYQREIERYLPGTMALSEELFFHDSQAIAKFLNLIEGKSGEEYRWLFAIRNIHQLLEDFEYTTSKKHQLMAALSEGFLQEFCTEENRKQMTQNLNDKYRQHRKAIDEIMHANDQDALLGEAIQCFTQRGLDLVTTVNHINKQLAIHDHQGLGLDYLMESYIHMTLNRTFVSQPRKHELVIYHHLERYYFSLLAREKKQAASRKMVATA